jgi:hypothetical protein
MLYNVVKKRLYRPSATFITRTCHDSRSHAGRGSLDISHFYRVPKLMQIALM